MREWLLATASILVGTFLVVLGNSGGVCSDVRDWVWYLWLLSFFSLRWSMRSPFLECRCDPLASCVHNGSTMVASFSGFQLEERI